MFVRSIVGTKSCRAVVSLPQRRAFSEMAEMKTRITTIKTTSGICSAMQNIAAAKVAMCEVACNQSRGFAHTLSAPFQMDAAHEDKVKKILIVPVSSNRGLCGGVNSQVRRKLDAKIEELSENGQKDLGFFFIGDRIRRAYNDRYGSPEDRIKGVVGRLDDLSKYTFATTLEIMKILNDAKEGYDKIIIAHNFYASKVKYVPMFREFYSKEISLADKPRLQQYECDALAIDLEENLSSLYDMSLAASLHQAIAEAIASEQASRMLAMDNATTNCDEMIVEMTSAYNRARQSAITAEICEITAGASAILDAE